ncbi:MAG: GtrA family protein [Acidiferrobacterales bacterium]
MISTIRERFPAGVFTRYVVLGVLSFVLALSLNSVLHEIYYLDERISTAGAIFVVFIFNYFMARKFVFSSDRGWMPQLVKFAMVSGGMRLSEFVLFFILFSIIGIHYLISYAISICIVFIVKYFAYKKIVFN